MNVLRTRKYSICMPPDLMMGAGRPEVPPWSYLLARFPAKKESEFFLFKKKKKKKHTQY